VDGELRKKGGWISKSKPFPDFDGPRAFCRRSAYAMGCLVALYHQAGHFPLA
jgi:hypothetical protein